jgi:hypothetical protein
MTQAATSAGEALEALRVAVERLVEIAPADSSGAALGEGLVELDVLEASLRWAKAQWAAAFDASGAAVADGLPTAAAWLRVHTTAAPGEARQLVGVGRALRDRLPAIGALLRDGRIGWASTATAVHALRQVRDRATLAAADAELAVHAPTLSPQELGHAARRILQHLDPDLAQADARRRWEDRGLTLSPMLDGAVSIRGQLDADGAAVLWSALAPMSTPHGPEDTRTGAQRRADALVDLVAKAAQIGAAGTVTGTGLPPTLLVRVDLQTLIAMDPASTKKATTWNGAPRNPLAELDWGGPILAETLARIGCTAQLIRIVTDGKSRVLDLGQSKRLAQPAQKLALAARDNGCVFPGCERPPEWSDAHHVIPWIQGGATDIACLVNLCRFHHRLVHEGGWTLDSVGEGDEVPGANTLGATWVFTDPLGRQYFT